jgi:hypothetical protein
MTGVGAAFGLQILLRNLESLAQGAKSPPRFLLMHWPVGTLRARYLPTGGNGTNYTISPILKPFETAGLRNDMIILYGFSDDESAGGGGGHEAGTPMTTTGANCPGTRRNGGEADDACAGGPSFDQIFLKNVPDLQRPGVGYANSICDARVDSLETSTQCLSYSYTTRSVTANSGGNINEAVPLLPELSPAQQYMKLFSGFMPGGSTPGNMTTLAKALRMRRSVLDFALGELAEIKKLAPGAEAPKIDLHTEAIRKVELQLSDQILKAESGTGGMGGAGGAASTSCTIPPAPDPNLKGKTGSHDDYRNPATTTADDAQHEQIGKVHASILRAAFVCDILRVGTFQWSPGTNHVSFKGLYPGEPNTIYMHHPLSHKPQLQNPAITNGSPPTVSPDQELYGFLQNVQTWYNQKTADILSEFKSTKDAFGNSLLDYTIIPFVTEVAESAHTRGPKPAMIFGGKALGMQGGQFQNFASGRPQQDLFVTIAQAFFGNSTPLTTNLSAEKFVKTGVSVIPGLWTKPG